MKKILIVVLIRVTLTSCSGEDKYTIDKRTGGGGSIEIYGNSDNACGILYCYNFK